MANGIKILNVFEKVYGLKQRPHELELFLKIMSENPFFMMPNNPEFHKLKQEEAKKLR